MHVFFYFFLFSNWVHFVSAQNNNLLQVNYYINQFLMNCYNQNRFNIYYWRDCQNQLADWYNENFATKYEPPVPNPTVNPLQPSPSWKYIPPVGSPINETPAPIITRTHPPVIITTPVPPRSPALQTSHAHRTSKPKSTENPLPSRVPTPNNSRTHQTTSPAAEQESTKTDHQISPTSTNTDITSESTPTSTTDESSSSSDGSVATSTSSDFVYIWTTTTNTAQSAAATPTAAQGNDNRNVPFVPGFDYLTFNSAKPQSVNICIVPLIVLSILLTFI
ncbi:hypothetical protein CONCODRAFT_72116 [Conidiobolus coronatus NRRL 28638]|uniref:Uncharacterized protein n=1 Tax=Conidiobolus coronatus (strain ATCC 28846 / CBS 209.66 / NRRL 28638) TaxID=796925 RepID=A0A137P0P9_CONC2|nr:hypothetical protein CONCODRAFT_72116 [Conidiobolus coronatus NRRL 28638]|eukprot:KXN68636.1 hypothetical protein CONCODRAFT_72116 [Conidiobolus coronatus NRRL 28638]